MIVTTEHGRYRIDEEGRGKFRVTVAEWFDRPAEMPCQSGRYTVHRGGKPVGYSGLCLGAITLRVGAQFTFARNEQDTDPCCGFSNRITGIAP